MTTRRQNLIRSLSCLLLATLCACASTGLAESWVDPDTKELPRFQKIFVAYLGVDAAAQRLAEDTLAARLESVEVLRCYELFPDARELDPARLKLELRAKGCDGAVVMRLARVEQQISATSAYPAPYYSFHSYWGYASPSGMDVRTDEIVHVETNVYSLADDKLIYTARSESFNPGSTARLVEEIAEAISEDLREKGLRR